jgi:site-specific recombinase XerD
MRPATLHRHLDRALAECKMAPLTWYQATRHTFASQWVLADASIENLSKMLGHASVVTTERYAHLRPGLFREADHAVLQVALAAGAAEPRPLLPSAGEAVAGG